MDQALTTLRFAWRRRALLARPLALPLALVVLLTLLEPDIDLAIVDLASTGFGAGSVAISVLARLAMALPFLACEAVAVAMIVALVAGDAERWLPSAKALRLALIAGATALGVQAALVLGRQLLLLWMGGLDPEELAERAVTLRAVLALLEDVDWSWAIATFAAVPAARRIFAGGAPAPQGGRVASAALLVLVAVNLVELVHRQLLAVLVLALGDAALLPISRLGDAALAIAALAVELPIIGMAVAVAALAGRGAARA